MTASTRRTVLALYMRVFRIARTWQSEVTSDTESERKYILQEARTLFRQNQQLQDQESVTRCIEECEARIEIGDNYWIDHKIWWEDPLWVREEPIQFVMGPIGLHYRNPYPRATYLPPMGLATQKGRKLRAQQRLRKQAKPIYLQSHEDT